MQQIVVRKSAKGFKGKLRMNLEIGFNLEEDKELDMQLGCRKYQNKFWKLMDYVIAS
jgi:hypothetical protein